MFVYPINDTVLAKYVININKVYAFTHNTCIGASLCYKRLDLHVSNFEVNPDYI